MNDDLDLERRLSAAHKSTPAALRIGTKVASSQADVPRRHARTRRAPDVRYSRDWVLHAANGIARVMKPVRVVVNDLMQRGYVYFLTEPVGRNFHPDFRPELTPKEMLELGVFGGKYMTDCTDEFSADWFVNAKLCPDRHDPQLNYYGVNASQPLSYWREKGWIYPEDPRGWFQWYCRYYMGRRCPYDDIQVRRWRSFRRHVAQVKKHCERGDWTCRPRQRQALLQWAYDSRKM